MVTTFLWLPGRFSLSTSKIPDTLEEYKLEKIIKKKHTHKNKQDFYIAKQNNMQMPI